MNTNENDRNEALDDVIELGVASVETKGTILPGDEMFGRVAGVGISE